MTRRTLRVNELLRREISQLLFQEIKDPRLKGLLSVTQVDTSTDLGYATVFVSVLGDDESKEAALRGLRSASGFIRKEMRLHLALRHIPELKFVLDEGMEQAQKMFRLMDRLVDDATSLPQGISPVVDEPD